MSEILTKLSDIDLITVLELNEIKHALKLQEIIKKLEHDLVTATLDIHPELFHDYDVSQLLADAIKESES